MPRRLMLFTLLLPAAALLLTTGAAAGTDDEDANKVVTVTTGDGDVVYEVQVDGEEASAATVGPYRVVAAAAAASAALDEVRELIDELAAAGELSEAGADKLRAALAKALMPSDNSIMALPADKYTSIAKTIVIKGDGDEEQEVKAYSIVVGDDAADGYKIIKLGKDGVAEPMVISIEEDGQQRVLTVIIGEDGEVKVVGEGFSEEQLDEFRQQIKESGARNIDVELEDGVIILKTDKGEDPAVMYLENLPELEGSVRLKQLQGLGMLEPSELQGLERLKQLQELGMVKLPEADNLEHLKQLQELGMLEPSELQGLERLKQLQELGMVEPPEMHGLERLKELQEQGMITLPEMQGLLKLEDLKELQGADVDSLLKLDGVYSLQGLDELSELKELQELQQLEELDAEWAAELEDEIAAVLEEIEQLLREFIANHGDS